jgi:hypothetical protein
VQEDSEGKRHKLRIATIVKSSAAEPRLGRLSPRYQPSTASAARPAHELDTAAQVRTTLPSRRALQGEDTARSTSTPGRSTAIHNRALMLPRPTPPSREGSREISRAVLLPSLPISLLSHQESAARLAHASIQHHPKGRATRPGRRTKVSAKTARTCQQSSARPIQKAHKSPGLTLWTNDRGLFQRMSPVDVSSGSQQPAPGRPAPTTKPSH